MSRPSSSAGLHNLLHLALAFMGVALLVVAMLDWFSHPLILWLNTL